MVARFPDRRCGGVVRHSRGSSILVALVVAALLPAQAPPVSAASAAGKPGPLPVSVPPPMTTPGSPSAHAAPSGAALDQRFAAPAAGGQGATPRTRQADAGYRQAKKPGQPVAPSPDWAPLGPARLPAARSGAAMVYDQARRQVVQFGGLTDAGAGAATTWTWDGSRWTDRTPSLATSPSARAQAEIAGDPVAGQVVLFGGVGGAGVLGDTWTWDGGAWTRRTPATSPPARAAGVMAWDPGLSRVVLYGGRLAGGRDGADTWAWDGRDWTQLHLNGTPARSRAPRWPPAGRTRTCCSSAAPRTGGTRSTGRGPRGGGRGRAGRRIRHLALDWTAGVPHAPISKRK